MTSAAGGMWFVPTYNRPQEFAAVMQRLRLVGCKERGLVIVQGREREEEYRQAALVMPTRFAMIILDENIGMCAALNFAYSRFPGLSWYGTFGDDEYVDLGMRVCGDGAGMSVSWEDALVGAAGAWGIAHGDDGIDSARRIRTYAVWGGELMRCVGEWFPAGLWHWYSDDIWEQLDMGCGGRLRKCVVGVKTENKHYVYGNAPWDKTYAQGESRSAEDRAVFEKWMKEKKGGIVERIKEGLPAKEVAK